MPPSSTPLLDPPNGGPLRKPKISGNIIIRFLRVLRKSLEEDGWIGWITCSSLYATLEDLRLILFVLHMSLWVVEDYFGEWFIRDPVTRIMRGIWKEPGSRGPLGEFLEREVVMGVLDGCFVWFVLDCGLGVVYSVLRWLTLEAHEVVVETEEEVAENESRLDEKSAREDVKSDDEKSFLKDATSGEKPAMKDSRGREKSVRQRRAPLNWIVNSWPFTVLFWVLFARRALIGLDVARVAWIDEMDAVTDAQELSKMDRSVINPYRFPLPADQEDVLRESKMVVYFLFENFTLTGLQWSMRMMSLEVLYLLHCQKMILSCTRTFSRISRLGPISRGGFMKNLISVARSCPYQTASNRQ
jgi:hypothetical protein